MIGSSTFTRRLARLAERAARFDHAFRYFSHEAERREDAVESEARAMSGRARSGQAVDDVAELWMRAARSRDMSELWRSQAGTWEWLGNFLGRALSDEAAEVVAARYSFRNKRGRSARFYVISDSEWRNPLRDDASPYGDPVAERRHRRAWAFTWAANCARSEGEFAHAARLYRRAGVAWEQSDHDGRLGRAALCYYEGALTAARAARDETRSMVVSAWCPSCVLEMWTERSCAAAGHVNDTRGGPEEQPASDIERLVRCWKSGASIPTVKALSGPFDALERQLAGIQRQLALNGATDEARSVYRRRRKERLVTRLRSLHPKAVIDLASLALSYFGTRMPQLIVSVICIYGGLIPTLWWRSGMVKVADDGHVATWTESLTFTLSGALTLWTGYFERGNETMNLALAVQSLSGVVAVGYAIWMMQRSYDE